MKQAARINGQSAVINDSAVKVSKQNNKGQ